MNTLLAVALLMGQTQAPAPAPATTGHVLSETRLHRLYGEYVIDAEGMEYQVEERLVLKSPAHITVGGDIQFHILVNKMHFTDNDGHEHIGTIIHQEVKK